MNNLHTDKRERVDDVSVEENTTILSALRQMDVADSKLLLVFRGDKFSGLVSIGDIQRALIANKPLDLGISGILRRDIRVAKVGDSLETIKSIMLEFRTVFMPVLDAAGVLQDVHFWDDIFSNRRPNRSQIDLPVVIMAGGMGTRLKPFSNVLPKPLFPLGERTVVEMIIDRFCDVGCRKFLMSVNYKAGFVEAYFDQVEKDGYSIEFYREPQPLGTAGSLGLIKDRIDETFFVSNCDIIVDTDYSEIFDYHQSHSNEITLVAALQHYQIPYGTLETAEGGRLISIQEKPEITHLINAGMYLLEPHLLNEIPSNEFFHITHLIASVMNRGGNVGVFPVSEKSWTDIGEWKKYDEAVSRFSPRI